MEARAPAATSPARWSSAGCSSSSSEPQKNGKTDPLVPGRRRRAPTAPASPQGIVCGAHNFAVGDLVVVVLPGAVLPGGFEISARKTYGHVSRRHDLLGPRARPRRRPRRHHRARRGGRPSARRSATTRSRCSASRRGPRDRGHPRPRLLPVAARRRPRVRAIASGAPFRDPADRSTCRPPTAPGYPVRARRRRAAAAAASAATASSPASSAASTPPRPRPRWMQRRLHAGGHAPDLAGRRRHQLRDARARPAAARVRPSPRLQRPDRASAGPRPGERLTTLDDVERTLRPRGPPRSPTTAARGRSASPASWAARRTEVGRRHDRRPRRGRALRPGHGRPHRPPAQAVHRGVQALRARRRPDAGRGRRRSWPCDLLRGARRRRVADAGRHRRRPPPARARRSGCDADLPAPARRAVDYRARSVVGTLQRGRLRGRRTTATDARRRARRRLAPRPRRRRRPRRGGRPAASATTQIPSVLPRRPGRPRADRTTSGHAASVAGALADAGFVEVLSYPFVGPRRPTSSGCRPTTRGARALRLANPLSDEAAAAAHLAAADPARRRCGATSAAGSRDVALFEIGPGHPSRAADAGRAASPASTPAPTPRRSPQLARGGAAPAAPGRRRCSPATPSAAGWWGPGRPADWSDAVDAARARRRAPSAVDADRDRGRARALAPRPVRAARRWPTGRWSATRVSCTQGASPPSACRPGPVPPSSTSTSLQRPAATGRRGRAGSRPSRVAQQDVALVVADGRPRRRGRGGAAPGRRRPAGVRVALRRLHRRPGRGRAQVAGLPARASGHRTAR